MVPVFGTPYKFTHTSMFAGDSCMRNDNLEFSQNFLFRASERPKACRKKCLLSSTTAN